jgi:hypothetical protein
LFLFFSFSFLSFFDNQNFNCTYLYSRSGNFILWPIQVSAPILFQRKITWHFWYCCNLVLIFVFYVCGQFVANFVQRVVNVVQRVVVLIDLGKIHYS